MMVQPIKPLCGECGHTEEEHAKPLRSHAGDRARGIAWCRHGDCMCRGYVIDVEFEVVPCR